MKITQVAAALPSLAPATPRLAEGAMLFELPVFSGDGGSGDGPAVTQQDTGELEQVAGNATPNEPSTAIPPLTVDGEAVRQMPHLPMPQAVARALTLDAADVSAAVPMTPEGGRAKPAIETIASLSSAPQISRGMSIDRQVPVAPSERHEARTEARWPDQGKAAREAHAALAIGAPSELQGRRVPLPDTPITLRGASNSVTPTAGRERRDYRVTDTVSAATATVPTDARLVGRSRMSVADEVVALPMPSLSASAGPKGAPVQSIMAEPSAPQSAVADSARPGGLEQVVALPARSARGLAETMPSLTRIEQPVAVPPRTIDRTETAPVAIVRQMGGEVRSRLTVRAAVALPRNRQIGTALEPTGATASRSDQPASSDAPKSGSIGAGMTSQQALATIDFATAPAELSLVADAPISSGMTRSVDAGAATSSASLAALEVDSGGQWLDRLAVEISACAASGGVRLKLSPDNLGELSIAVSTSVSGASVVIGAQDEGVLSAIAGAQDRLIAEARANGLRLADVQTGLTGESGTGTREQMRQSPQSAMPDRFNQPKRTLQPEIDNHERANPAGRWA